MAMVVDSDHRDQRHRDVRGQRPVSAATILEAFLAWEEPDGGRS
jgi:hypothetical protein